MPKKKQKEQKAPNPPPFSNNPFTKLKGIVLEEQTQQKPVEKKKETKPEQKSDELFIQAMAGVRRLDNKEPVRPAVKKTGKFKKEEITGIPTFKKPLPREEIAARKTFLQELEKLQLDVQFKDSLPEDDELRPLPGNRLKQIKRGIIKLNRQLDLHGLTREEAVESLMPFLRSAQAVGEKAVLVITGKGIHSAVEPVLQQTVAAWLRDQGRELVGEFAPAPPEMGGNGAFVIFLHPLTNN